MKEITLCNTEEFDRLSRFVWGESKNGYAKKTHLGLYSNISDADEAYQGAARKLYPEDFK